MPVGLVAAAAVALVLLFFTAPLQYVPMAALGACYRRRWFVLDRYRSVGLFYQIDRTEAVLSVLAHARRCGSGGRQRRLFAVVLALLRFIKLMSRPRVKFWARSRVFQDFTRSSDMRAVRKSWDAATLVSTRRSPFFNAPYFKRGVVRVVDEAGPNLRHVVIDLFGYQHRCNRTPHRLRIGADSSIRSIRLRCCREGD